MSITEACYIALTVFGGITTWVVVDLAALAKSLMERPPTPQGQGVERLHDRRRSVPLALHLPRCGEAVGV